jgi:hypothetical protein
MPKRKKTNAEKAIAAAERILPGRPYSDGTRDKRWQAMIRIGDHIQSDPELIWPFVLQWGSYKDEDLRAAVATILLEHLLEHLLEYHFDLIFPRVRTAAHSNSYFAKTFQLCAKFGQAEEKARAMRFDRLKESL